MDTEAHLRRLKASLQPDTGMQERVRERMMKRIQEPDILAQAKTNLTPSEAQRGAVWNRIRRNIDSPAVSGLLQDLRSFLSPSEAAEFLVRTRLMTRLTPVHVRSSYRWSKLAAAFVLVLVALRISPVLFLAPRTVAESTVNVVPTKGSVELSLHDLWQPMRGEVIVSQPVQLRTQQGEATIILHDDGTIRLGAETSVSLHDLSDRPEPALDNATLTLSKGRIWVQGLLQDHLRGITITTPAGDITIHDGSVSIAVGDDVIVRAWDRHVRVTREGMETVLVAGERARMRGDDATIAIASIEEDEYADAWVTQNLERDAVHQRAIAQLQQERRAAQAGILPTSALYPVKRVAENIDVLLTLDPEEKLQKQLDQASTRLNEAAAMIAEGSDAGAAESLEEYKETMLTIASGSGDSVTQFLVRQEAVENSADLAAALPDDESYVLKRTVLEASAALPVDIVNESDVEMILVVDTIGVLREAIANGDATRAKETYAAIEPFISAIRSDESNLKPEVRKEILNMLSQAAEHLEEQTGTGMIVADGLDEDLKPFLPQRVTRPEVQPLTDEQIDALVQQIRSRIFTFDQQRSRWNQLTHEIRQLKGHPDEGRILRRLYHALPEDGLARYVRPAIQELREENEQ